MKEKPNEEKIIHRSGIPLDEKGIAEWKKAFTDMEECFALASSKNNTKNKK